MWDLFSSSDYLTDDLKLARVEGFHLQGMEGCNHSELLQTLANAADGSFRLARRVKIKEE
jgi:hypothetical protein